MSKPTFPIAPRRTSTEVKSGKHKGLRATKAKGLQGYIMLLEGKEPFFRVYHESPTGLGWVDYTLEHWDLKVEIIDSTAALFKRPRAVEGVLDYSEAQERINERETKKKAKRQNSSRSKRR